MILLDNGHGSDTPGKRSPVWSDGLYVQEWRYARMVVDGIADGLERMGIPYAVLVPEEKDVPLGERCFRANRIAARNGDHQVLLVSVHLNASDVVNKGSGWEIHTYKGTSASDEYAKVFWNCAKEELGDRFPMRGDFIDGDPDWDSNFAILRDTVCPAVLTENLFMTNEKDCRFLMSDEGFKTIVDIHLKAIAKICGISE